MLNSTNLLQYSYISSHPPVVFPRLWSQAAVHGTTDRCLSSIPRLLDERPADDIKQRPGDSEIIDDGYATTQLRAYCTGMKRVSRHFCTCQRHTIIISKAVPEFGSGRNPAFFTNPADLGRILNFTGFGKLSLNNTNLNHLYMQNLFPTTYNCSINGMCHFVWVR